MNFNIYYIAWIFLVSIQTILFATYYFKHAKQQKESAPDGSQEVDMVEFLVYNNIAYWMEESSIVRARYKDRKVFLSTKEKVNPFELKDIDVSEYMDILNKLEQV